jgi:hypothetical protein
VVNHAREAWGPFIAPQENLAGVRNLDMFGSGAGHVWPPSLNPAAKSDNAERTDMSGKPDMSGQSLWNPDAKPDKAERSDMSGLRAGHVRPESLESG